MKKEKLSNEASKSALNKAVVSSIALSDIMELIKEMELRVDSFDYNMNLYETGEIQYSYWNGKRSESAFMVEKLTWLLENGSL